MRKANPSVRFNICTVQSNRPISSCLTMTKTKDRQKWPSGGICLEVQEGLSVPIWVVRVKVEVDIPRAVTTIPAPMQVFTDNRRNSKCLKQIPQQPELHRSSLAF